MPGPALKLEMVDMKFCYSDYFGIEHTSGYETLLYDSMIGEALLFARADNLEHCWTVVDPVLKAWSELPPETLPIYPAGTWGPAEAVNLIERDGRKWRSIEQPVARPDQQGR